MYFAIATLGCKVNQFESQAMERELLRRGHNLVPFNSTADAYIINSCAVTAESGKKSRALARRARKLAPYAVVALCGCYAQTDPQAASKLDVDLIGGSNDRIAFLNLLEESVQNRGPQKVAVDQALKRRDFEELEAGGLEGRTRALLKVQDGCVNFCSYCIIPFARGPLRSLPLDRAIVQVNRIANQGYQELVLTGIEISSWGVDFHNGCSLIDLVESVCNSVPNLRVRLGSLEPRTITQDFCRRAAQLPNLCPHFHLSLQSGCDSTLQRMNRKYDTARYLESVDLLRATYDDPAVTSDLIVGFPQETEEEFTQTLAFLQRCHFAALHIFPYSRRKGTPAASMDGQVPNALKEDRARRAAAVAKELEQAYLERQVGRTLSVLFEDVKDGLWQGHAPNYTLVRLEGDQLHNCIRDVRITAVEGSALRGQLV